MFPCSLAQTTDDLDHPWVLSSNGEFLGVWRSNFLIFQSTRRSPMYEYRGVISAF